jgi:hypothetical protein
MKTKETLHSPSETGEKKNRICPKCKKGGLTERVRRPILVKVLLCWLPLKRYRCYHCYKKTYVLM